MSSAAPYDVDSQELVRGLIEFIDRAVAQSGGSTTAVKPAHRVKFHWPPHPISYNFHVHATDWSGRATLSAHGEEFPVEVARTPHGVFGRCESLWLEARGESLPAMLRNMGELAEPLFRRQITIAKTLERPGRFTGHLRDLPPLDILKLLYCEDRDVANDARIEIEKHARSHVFTPALIQILRDKKHPHRRSAQWCVLDLFEDLPTYCTNEAEELEAIEAMSDLIWAADDDYARTVYKAGVVLGGHIPHIHGGPVLIDCLKAPSKIGRRSAIHGLYHVVEWMPEMQEKVLAALAQAAETDSEPVLREYAKGMAHDIENEIIDHVPEPVFPEEQ